MPPVTTLWNHARAALLPALMGAARPGAVVLLSGCGGRAGAPSSAPAQPAQSPSAPAPPAQSPSASAPPPSAPAQSPSASSPSAAPPGERDSAPVASEGLDGVYLRTHEIAVFDGERWEPLEVDDCLRIRRVGANQLELEVQLVAANAHLCSIDGVASRLRGVEEIYELRPEPADEPCQLRLVVGAERLELVDVEHQCRQYYCGARAGFDGVSFARTERRPARRGCAD